MVITSYIFLIIGGLFYMLGGLGVLRMPDTFNRIQAGTKATTLGAFSIMIGIFFAEPTWVLKVVVIIIFIAISNPIGSSVIARATHRSHHRPTNLVVDELHQGGDTHDHV
jgi:multicomponent Na+:H+ antiporter subunit G